MENDAYRAKLEELCGKYPDWEENEQALDYGLEIWKATEEYVEATHRGAITSTEKKADKVFHKLMNSGMLKSCLTDKLRKLVIRYHARNKSTTDAVVSILHREDMEKITPFYLFRHPNVCGYENIKKFLVARLSYLTPSNVRWPRKKYDAYWKEARQEYLDSIDEIPLTHVSEQLQELSEHYQHLKEVFKSTDSASDKDRLSACMMRVMAGIHQMTKDPIVNAAHPLELTQEKNPKALPTPNDDNILEIPAEGVIVEAEK